MSGLHNHRNGQFGHQHHYHKFASFHNVVSLSLPRVMNRAGYRTAHIGKYHVAPETVYEFETYLKGNGRNAVAMADKCKEFITQKEDDRPFFLYFGTSDPHRGGGKDNQSELELKQIYSEIFRMTVLMKGSKRYSSIQTIYRSRPFCPTPLKPEKS